MGVQTGVLQSGLGAFENRVQRATFRVKREELGGERSVMVCAAN